ncbi:unnamed protein product [Ambrosiozyma monospora]|uniref:Unnamed protein product n=1 Tax=Ambrosiozyma monospora TaxID=43982 RepID=A0ACB5T4A4_AMBMO|nr:unnamed protein product [Ambrosiozyma monospora]
MNIKTNNNNNEDGNANGNGSGSVELPQWLKDVFGCDLGATELARKFAILQTRERDRINYAILNSKKTLKVVNGNGSGNYSSVASNNNNNNNNNKDSNNNNDNVYDFFSGKSNNRADYTLPTLPPSSSFASTFASSSNNSNNTPALKIKTTSETFSASGALSASSSASPPCFSAGVELGRKNRYKDVFPFEHSRVKIKKSGVLPLGAGHRRDHSSVSSASSGYSGSDDDHDHDDDCCSVHTGRGYSSASSNSGLFSASSCMTSNSESSSNFSATTISPASMSNSTSQYDQQQQQILDQEDDLNSNYINASYLHTKPCQSNYIATQGPLQDTIGDFWKVVMDHRIPFIVSLTAQLENSVEKCAPYWQSGNYIASNGSFLKVVVMNEEQDFKLSEDSKSVVVLRWISVELCNGDVNEEDGFVGTGVKHEVLQVHVLSWPDYGALFNPMDLLLLVGLKRWVLRQIGANSDKLDDMEVPVLVHCSAGCGRTGCFCVIDSCIELLMQQKGQGQLSNSTPGSSSTLNMANFSTKSHSNSISTITSESTTGSTLSASSKYDKDQDDLIFNIVDTFRMQRAGMVQNLRQFIMIYDCVLSFIKLQNRSNINLKSNSNLSSSSDSFKIAAVENQHDFWSDHSVVLNQFIEKYQGVGGWFGAGELQRERQLEIQREFERTF